MLRGERGRGVLAIRFRRLTLRSATGTAQRAIPTYEGNARMRSKSKGLTGDEGAVEELGGRDVGVGVGPGGGGGSIGDDGGPVWGGQDGAGLQGDEKEWGDV